MKEIIIVQKKMDVAAPQTADEPFILSIQNCNGASSVFPQDMKTLSDALVSIYMNGMVSFKPEERKKTGGWWSNWAYWQTEMIKSCCTETRIEPCLQGYQTTPVHWIEEAIGLLHSTKVKQLFFKEWESLFIK